MCRDPPLVENLAQNVTLRPVYFSGSIIIPGGACAVDRFGNDISSFSTAIRELREEAGLPRGIISKIPISYDKNGYSYSTYPLKLSFAKELYTPKLNWEHDEWRWFGEEEILNDPMIHEGVKFVIEELQHFSI